MVEVTIDGRSVSVEAGITVLEAARRLGIRIPTLCFVEGLEPSSSCFMCAVQVEGKANLSPSCALPVADGMVVTTDSEDVRAARKMAIELLLSDHAGDCVAPCRARCPADLDIAGFTYEIAYGDTRRAMEIILDKLGTARLTREDLSAPLRTRVAGDAIWTKGWPLLALHRYPADMNRDSDRTVCAAIGPSPVENPWLSSGRARPVWPPLSTFYRTDMLARCTMLNPSPAACCDTEYPAYRLPKDALDAEIETIRGLGARFQMSSVWGADFTLENCDKRTTPFFLASAPGVRRVCGAKVNNLPSPVSSSSRKSPRTSRRPSATKSSSSVAAIPPWTRPAPPFVLVHQMSRSSIVAARQEMPCLMEEVEEAEHEGVVIDLLVAPLRLEKKRVNGSSSPASE